MRKGQYNLINSIIVECVPSKNLFPILATSANPVNFPVQAGSLTGMPFRATGAESKVTKLRDRKPVLQLMGSKNRILSTATRHWRLCNEK